MYDTQREYDVDEALLAQQREVNKINTTATEKRAYDLTARLLLVRKNIVDAQTLEDVSKVLLKMHKEIVKNDEIYAETLIQLNNAHIKIAELERLVRAEVQNGQ